MNAHASITVSVPLKLVQRGGRKLVVTPDTAAPGTPNHDHALLKAVVRAFYWKRQLDERVHATISDLARAENLNISFVAHILRLTLLDPQLIAAILDGSQPESLLLQSLMRHVPEAWIEQASSGRVK